MSEIVTPEDGIYTDASMSDYLNWPLWSASLLDVWRTRTPNYARWQRDRGHTDETTLARTLGTVTHAAVLEPDTFEERYIAEPEPDPEKFLKGDGTRGANVRALKSFKDAVAELAATGKSVVKRDVYDAAIVMRDALQSNPDAAALLAAPGPFEASLVVTDPEYGVRLKGRPDKLVTSPVVANCNLKTSQNAARDAFSVDLFQFRYYVDFAFYERVLVAAGFEKPKSVAIAVDTTGPKDDRVAVHELDEGTLSAGRELVEKYLAEIAACEERDRWPGHPKESRMISLPPWAWRRVDDELAEPRMVIV